MRELYAHFAGNAKMRIRDRQLVLWHAWHVANFTNAKKLPDLPGLLRKLEPLEARVMSPRAQRATILGMAHAMGAKIEHRKKSEVH